MRPLLVLVFAVLIVPAHRAAAQDEGPLHAAIAAAASAATLPLSGADDPQSPAPRRVAFEYSEAYQTRAKIHKYASIATLPLFATEFALGQSLYNKSSEGKKGAHVAIGTGIVGLYGVQAVTGVWNLVEAKKDPNGRKRRVVHSILMLASGAGFAITPMVAPGERERFESGGGGSRGTHRAVAFTSIGIGTAGYLLMLLGGK
jgi:hypothetical protein